MKALKAILLFSFPVFFLTSCSNEFEVIDAWKDIPVVYGLLNNQDSVQYIRVEKAFLDADANALDLAKIPDSLYYENISVTLENTENPSESYTLQKVDGNVENIPRDNGIFATTPNYLYKLALGPDGQLSGSDNYTLTLDRGDSQEPVTAETGIINDIELRTPNENSLLRIPEDGEARIRWSNDPAVAFYTLKFRINYLEEYPGADSLRTLTWVINDNIESSNDPEDPSGNDSAITYEFLGELFYQFLANNIDAGVSLTRIFLNIDVIVIGGGHELYRYLEVGKINTGLTSSQFTPTYTNLSEGLGVLSTQYTLTKNKGVTTTTLTSIKESEWTAGLNFR